MNRIVLKCLLTVLILSFVLTIKAQVVVSGQVIGNDAPEGLIEATVVLESQNNYYETRTEDEGFFSLTNVQGSPEGIGYSLTIALHGYERHESNLNVQEENVNVGIVRLDEHAWPPRNLEINLSAEADTMFIQWNTPRPSYLNEGWFHWDAGYNMGDAIGTGQAAEFIVTQRFTPESLADFNVIGLSVTSVRFFPNEANATYTIKIYEGGSNDPLQPGDEIVSQLVAEINNEEWNEVELDEHVPITGEQELWIGYHVNTMVGHPLGCDPGPAVNDYGNLINIDDQWTTLSAIDEELDYNWNIHAFAIRNRGDRGSQIKLAQPNQHKNIKPTTKSENQDNELLSLKSNNRPTRMPKRSSPFNNHRALEGYNIYRLIAGQEETPEDWTYLTETADTVYADSTWNDVAPGFYKYAVQAIYTNGIFSEYVFSEPHQNELLFNLTGRIIASDNEEGLAGAFISFEGLEDYATISEEDGSFSIENILGSVDPVRYDLNITKRRYVDHNSNHDVTNTNINLGNIRLYIESYPARKLNAEINQDEEVDLNWYSPAPGFPQWLHWDSGENNDGIGTGGQARFRVVSRFSVEKIVEADVDGLFLNSIRFFPIEEAATYTIKVWLGGSTDPLDPGQLMTSQLVEHFEVEEWNEVNLSEPVEILPNQELWFGYEVDTPRGFPAGADEGPHKDYYGNIIHIGNTWRTLYDLNNDLTYNWNLQGFAGHNAGGDERCRFLAKDSISDETDPTASLSLKGQDNLQKRIDKASNHGYYRTNTDPSIRRINSNRSSTYTSHSRSLEEYQLFRFKTEDRHQTENWEHIYTSQDTSYTDTEWIDLVPGIYQYAVKASYANDSLSVPTLSNILLKDMYCQVKIELTSNSGDPVTGAVVTLTNIDGNSRHIYSDKADEDGIVILPDVWRGSYNVSAKLFGFDRYVETEVDVDDIDFHHEIRLIEALYPVANLEHEIFNNNNVLLRWEKPGSDLRTEQWIHWDNGDNYDAIGSNGPLDFKVASRFTPEAIKQLNIEGLYIDRIKFYPYEPTANYTLKIWRGGRGTPLWAGEEVMSQPVTSIANNEWNEVLLEQPILIPADEEIWFGYHVTTQTGYPAGIDEGTAHNKHGDLIYINNQWRTLTDLNPNFDNNWNLWAYATELDGGKSKAITRNPYEHRSESDNPTRKLLGYKVFRDDQLIAEDLENMSYRDISIPIGNYKYSIVAQYTTGESKPRYTEEVAILDTSEQIDLKPHVTQLKRNYPNPFNPATTIAFSLAGEQRVRISIHNIKGQTMKNILDEILPVGMHDVIWNGKNDHDLEVSSGIYFYKMETDSYTEKRKMLLLR